MIDLTRNSQAFRVDAVDNNPRLPVEAQEYLHEIKLNGLTIRCCSFKDIINGTSVVVPDDSYTNYRFAKLTVPTGFQYVNYTIDGDNNVVVVNKSNALVEGIHSLMLLNVNKDSTLEDFHICNSNHLIKDVFTSAPYACVKPAMSMLPTAKNNKDKHFHLFYFKEEKVVNEVIVLKVHYFIPLLMSQGTIVYYMIEEENLGQIPNALNTFAKEALSRSDTQKDFWKMESIVAYESLDILTSTNVTPGIVKND